MTAYNDPVIDGKNERLSLDIIRYSLRICRGFFVCPEMERCCVMSSGACIWRTENASWLAANVSAICARTGVSALNASNGIRKSARDLGACKYIIYKPSTGAVVYKIIDYINTVLNNPDDIKKNNALAV